MPSYNEKQCKYLEDISMMFYNGRRDLNSSGRLIAALRSTMSVLETDLEKDQYAYAIQQCLNNHSKHLQEAIINTTGKPKINHIPLRSIQKYDELINSPLSATNGKYSMVDIEDLKIKTIFSKHVPNLNKNVVLPCKTKVNDSKYDVELIINTHTLLPYLIGYELDIANQKTYDDCLVSEYGKGLSIPHASINR